MLTPDLAAELDAFLIDLNRASGEVILPLFRIDDHGLEDKGGVAGFDPVTQADKGAEAAIRKLIAERYPHHGVIGEEYGEDRPDAEFVWVLDPVDGTRAFIAGLPVWTTLIALRWQGNPVMGSIGQPYVGEIFIGHGKGGGARLINRAGERPLKVRPCPVLTDAIIMSTDPTAYFDGAELGAWRQVAAAAKLTRLGCDAYAYAMVAAGTVDLVAESRVCKAWDIEVAVPLIEGAGGVVTNWRGEPIGRNGGQIVMAGDRAVLDEALVALKRSAD
ncbi:MAG TPA: histidinol-phosphatase [Phenylobacterium sp.]|jgi:histidinol phosphatase-like enzyme (inositol monophosphatase family)|uniref:Histidinol-phosphatase n=1 Tax=Phenylobacterium conjunctum TaxID=1298959 RepID=A0ABW3SZ41_9CAUL|nr:histidinol-phosphatase [Phenylobacterium sp.]